MEFEPTAGESQLNRPSGIDDLSGSPFEDMYNEFMDPGSMPQQGMADEFRPESMTDPFQENLMAGEEPLTAESTRNWWVWAVLTPVLLIAGGWIIWRTRVSGPTGFTPDLPPILFERLQRWASRLGLTPPVGETPYEQAGRLGTALPEGRAPISAITEEYVRYRFSRDHAASVSDAQAALPDQWRVLQPLLWRNWLRKLVGLRPVTANGHFDLVQQDTRSNGKSTPNGPAR